MSVSEINVYCDKNWCAGVLSRAGKKETKLRKKNAPKSTAFSASLQVGLHFSLHRNFAAFNIKERRSPQLH
jgi:hypothetical protein